jgi:hypothetical protein
MRLNSLMMTMLLAVNIGPSLAQTKPIKPGTSTQTSPPAKVTNVKGLLAWFGDPLDKVRAAYHTDQEVTLPGPTAGSQARSFLWIESEGVTFIFDEKEVVRRVGAIRLDPPFSSKVHGVLIGDGLAHLLKLLGPPSRRWEPTHTPYWEFYTYSFNDMTVLFEMKHDVVTTMWLYRTKSDNRDTTN